MGPFDARGVVRYSYDALGDAEVKQTDAQQALLTKEWTENTFDALGRPAQTSVKTTSGGTSVLYVLAYDNGVSAPANCGEAATTNSAGRLRKRTDSFGQTWYSYDMEGRVVRETRIRGQGLLDCSLALSADVVLPTIYGYSGNGNLTSIRYPHGRNVTYGYGSGALKDRVATVSVETFEPGAGTRNLLTSVA